MIRAAWVSVVQTVLRWAPFPTRTGLVPIGRPGRDAPVVLTCNFGLTVQRVRHALAGLDAWLLVANSRGVNVWCAATGGLFTDHDVVSVLKTSGIGDRVDHRRVILPQLAATGIDGKAVRRRTGWQVVWGPVEAADLPRFIASAAARTVEPIGAEARALRTVRFPLARRLEMAVVWAFPLSVIATVVLLVWQRGAVLPAAALVWGIALAVFAAFPAYTPWLRATAHWRFGQLVLALALWVVLMAAWLAVDALRGRPDLPALVPWGLGSLLLLLILGIDLAGSTPVYKSGLMPDNRLAIALDPGRCSGAAFCSQVCPKAVFEMDHARNLAVLARPAECVQCGACIVQCPFDALSFVAPDGATVTPATVREFRLNLLGTRTRPVPR